MFLFSSAKGFDTIAIENQTCGIPVVGSDVGGIPEAVGNGGIVVETLKDFENKFAEAVVRVLNERIDSFFLRGGIMNYTWQSIIKEEIQIYSQIGG